MRRSGFTVIEALVVLLIGAAALLLVFQVGVDGSRTGLRLGNRALSVVEAEPGIDSLRLALRGWLPDVATGVLTAEMRGDARGLSGRMDLERPTLCAEAGPARRLDLILVSTSDGDLLTCAAPGAEAATLVDLRPARGRFAYSADGEHWSAALGEAVARTRGDRLYVRFTSSDGALDIIEDVHAFDDEAGR